MLILRTVTETIAVIGASRGIGQKISEELENRAQLLLVSRRFEGPRVPHGQRLNLDLTNDEDVEQLLKELEMFRPKRIFYVAGGGPFGPFEAKNFKDHLWAYRLNLLTPARLLHWALGSGTTNQIIFFGSNVAEDKPDKFASSYSSAKHGLRGLVTSVQAENPNKDIRLYSPGYTATTLLPKSAQEKLGAAVKSVDDVVQDFLKWALSESDEKHRIY